MCIRYDLNVNYFMQVNDDEKNVTDIWISVTDFTSREDVSYYGHEIFNILDLITALLERQTKEMNGTVGKDELLLQIDSSNYGTDTTNNLISNDAQWAQLDNVLCSNKFETKGCFTRGIFLISFTF